MGLNTEVKMILFLVVMHTSVLMSQNSSREEYISKKVKLAYLKIKNEEYSSVRKLNKDFVKYPRWTYQNLKKYEDDPLERVIDFVEDKYLMLLRNSDDSEFRIKLIETLMNINEKHVANSGGLIGSIPSLVKLSTLNNKDFSKESRKVIERLLRFHPPPKMLIMLIGKLYMNNYESEIKKLLPNGSKYIKPDTTQDFYFNSIEWEARLALARMGDSAQIDTCLQKIKSYNFLSNVYSASKFFDALVYISQPHVVHYLYELTLLNAPFEHDDIYTTSVFSTYALKELGYTLPLDYIGSLDSTGVFIYKKWIEENRGYYPFLDSVNQKIR